MTIKLTDDVTMSKANNAFWGCEKTPSLDRLRAAAAVFETAANGQVEVTKVVMPRMTTAQLQGAVQR